MSKQLRIRTERILMFATAAVLVVALGFVFWSIARSTVASRGYLHRMVESEQQLLRVRLAGLVHELEGALVMEAAKLENTGNGSGPDGIVDHWKALLSSHWAVTMVALADEYGNETALIRNKGSHMLRRTVEGSQHGPSMTFALPLGDGEAPLVPMDSSAYDPRTRLWFSKALEDARDSPVWTFVRLGADSIGKLQLSLLQRATEQDGAFRVLMLEIDPERIPWLDLQRYGEGRPAMLIMHSDGHVLDRNKSAPASENDRALLTVADAWNNKRTNGPFSSKVEGREYLASFGPFALNGETLYTGILLDAEPLIPMVRRERTILIILASLLVLLTTLLGSLWWRSRVAAAELRRQERRSRSQELRLAKVLGEREVLNREVHHRVKNNLQVVSSLLSLQAASLDDGMVRDEFLRGKQRIDTIALVHHKLYALKDLRNVDLELFFDALTKASAQNNEPHSHTVSFDVETQGLKCDQDTAIGLGIILCELMSNAFRHAFPYATGGHIDVQMQAVEGDLHRLVVKDNGKGMDGGTTNGQGKLGLEIVEALADQLDGSFHTRTNGGTTFEVLFRMRTPENSANATVAQADTIEQSTAGL